MEIVTGATIAGRWSRFLFFYILSNKLMYGLSQFVAVACERRRICPCRRSQSRNGKCGIYGLSRHGW